MDNIFTERLWRTIKYEEVYLKEYVSPRDARRSLAEYLDFYNYRRLHQALDYQTPAVLYYAQAGRSDHHTALPAAVEWAPECVWQIEAVPLGRAK